jgi:hypothetical protein
LAVKTWVDAWAALGAVSDHLLVYGHEAATELEAAIRSGAVRARMHGETELPVAEFKRRKALPLRDMELNRPSFQKWLKGLEPALIKGSKRGPKASYDWEGCWAFMAKVAHDEGLPPTQAEMVERVRQWFIDTIDEHPSDTEIKRRVSRLYRELGR